MVTRGTVVCLRLVMSRWLSGAWECSSRGFGYVVGGMAAQAVVHSVANGIGQWERAGAQGARRGGEGEQRRAAAWRARVSLSLLFLCLCAQAT